MKSLSDSGAQAVDDLARRHGFSPEAVRHMLEAVSRGGGGMAQFSHADFSGSGQWMRGGMTMVSDMFNDTLKGRVSALCQDLSTLLQREPGLFAAAPEVATGGGRYARSGDWWPAGMGHPNSAGSQNGVRYAYFARARRLAIERDGALMLYDTLDHDIGGVSQQQGATGSLRFASQHGPIDVDSLPVV